MKLDQDARLCQLKKDLESVHSMVTHKMKAQITD